jgi:hypothetical protein
MCLSLTSARKAKVEATMEGVVMVKGEEARAAVAEVGATYVVGRVGNGREGIAMRENKRGWAYVLIRAHV